MTSTRIAEATHPRTGVTVLINQTRPDAFEVLTLRGHDLIRTQVFSHEAAARQTANAQYRTTIR